MTIEAKDPYLPDAPPDYRGDPDKDWRPARGYKWKQWEPENLGRLRHGIFTERFLAPSGEEAVNKILEYAPELANPRFMFALQAWSRAEARVFRIHFWLDLLDVLDANEREPRDRWLRELRSEERLAKELRSELGLAPVAFAKLQTEMMEAARNRFSLKDLLAEGERIRAERDTGKGRRVGSGVPPGSPTQPPARSPEADDA